MDSRNSDESTLDSKSKKEIKELFLQQSLNLKSQTLDNGVDKELILWVDNSEFSKDKELGSISKVGSGGTNLLEVLNRVIKFGRT